MGKKILPILVAAAACASAAPKNQRIVEADAEGNVIETEAERKRRADTSLYVIEPLGEACEQKLDTEMKRKPVFRPRRAFEPGMRLFGAGGVDAVIVAQHGAETQRVLNELRWHLERMIGREILVTPRYPEDGRPAITVRYTTGSDERSVVRIDDGVLYIEGADSVGMSHALTYVLEALGCRYLWPGPTGKIVPRKTDVFLPKGLALDFVPQLSVVRRIRDYYSCHENRVRYADQLGIDVLKAKEMQRMAGVDRFENRSFWEWHGINDSKKVPGGEPMNGGTYRWEHRFNDYYIRFGKDHPEWFALQADGTRNQDARPTFCMSNMELVEQIAKETVELIDRYPEVRSHSLCLPDGGYHSFCLCENCRRLDPKNLPRSIGKLYYPVRRPVERYSYTDRVLFFKNAVAERVAKARPGKRLSIYVYSSYVNPPFREKPHPSFLIISVAGEYTSPEQRAWARSNLAAWSTFGNPFVWRPNALRGFQTGLPQNISRCLFDDVELFKANGLVGTDFDCMSGCWPARGLDFYILAKAHLNPDRLSYDDFYDDYLTVAFGRAAPAMRKYYDCLYDAYNVAIKEVSKMRAAAASARKPVERGAHNVYYRKAYEAADPVRFLDEARTLSADDADAAARVAFVRIGAEIGRRHLAIIDAARTKAPDLARLQREAAEFFRETFLGNPLTLSPSGVCGRHLGRDPLGLQKR